MAKFASRLDRRFYALFLLSGATGLGYQIVWAKRLAMGLGHEVPAVLAVVAAFFAGMAAGAWIFDRPIAKSSQPGFWYAGLEAIVGFWGAATIELIPLANRLGVASMGISPSPFRHWLLAFLIPFLILLPATMALGATFPAMERFIAGSRADRRCVGAVYSANTFGAVLGVLTMSFFLMPPAGFKLSTAILAAGNLICAGLAYLLAKNQEIVASTARFDAGPQLNWILFGTGFLGIGYEIVGLRAMSQILTNTVFTYAVILAVFLAGTAFGGSLEQRFGGKWQDRRTRGHILAATALAALLGAFAVSKAVIVYDWLRNFFSGGMYAMMSCEMAVAVMVYGLTTVGMGSLFSHLTQASKRADCGIGRASAINTLGGALAAPVFGLWLIPTIGLKWSFVAIAGGYLALATRSLGWRWPAAALVLVLFLLSDLHLLKLEPGSRIRESRQGVLGSVAVVEDTAGDRVLRVDNRFQMGGTAATVALRRQAHIPLLLHGAAKRALFLGVGTGITLGGAENYSGVRVDGVELLEEVLAVAPHFAPANGEPWANPKVRLFVADARRFVRSGSERYDVIVADLFHPARDGAGSLYTVEHFLSVRERLAAGGLFCQWLPLHQMDSETTRLIARSFLEAFPNAEAFLLRFNIDAPVIGLVGRTAPARYAGGWVERQLTAEALRAQLKQCALNDSVRLFGCWLAGANDLRAYTGPGKLNTDDHPVVTFRAPHFEFRKSSRAFDSLFDLLARPRGDAGVALGLKPDNPLTGEVRAFVAARDIYLKGLREEMDGRIAEAISDYLESARRSEEFTSGYSQCITLASILARRNPSAAQQLLERLVAAQPKQPLARELLRRMKAGE